MHNKTLAELSAALRDGEVSSSELTRHMLQRIKMHNERLNSFVTVTEELALDQARAADERIAAGQAGPLTGIPIAHKDIFCTRDVRTSCGSRMLENFIAPYDATVVDKLRHAGAVMLGKTNMDEFAMGSSNETSWFGPVRNPWDTETVPGGSSGGSAAAVAARLCAAATGTDTGGSIRQPAALTGITGLKPTYGRCSRWGMIAFASSLDQAGPMTRTAEDAALMLAGIAGFDERDSTSAQRPVDDYAGGLDRPIAGVRIGVVREFMGDGLDEGVGASVESALEELKRLGAELVEVSLPNAGLSVPVYYVVAPAECSSNLARFDGVRYGHRCDDPKDLEDLYKRSRSEGFGPEVKRRIMIGTYALSAGYYDAYYLKAQKVRQLIADDFRRAFEQCDLIVGPTAPGTAFRLGEKADDPVSMYLSDIYTIAVNLAGLPGMSIPAAASGGMPVGLQLIGNYFDETRLLNVAHQLQLATDYGTGRSPGALNRKLLMQWETVIGLEIHTQLATKSKIFSGSSTAFGAAPNTQASLIDLGMPGVLPVLNKGAVRMAVRFGKAIGAQVAERSVFARKNYFYPDLPKGYQISQYELPVVGEGVVEIVLEDGSTKTVGVTRAHLEEDAGKSLHDDFHGMTGIDLNRAGTPLLEIVSEPDLRSAREAVAYAKKIHQIVTYIGICDGSMQEGSFRMDANVSIRPKGQVEYGTRAELKNINSFRFLEKAINFEVERQIEVIEDGGRVIQETRLYDASKDETRSMRTKEEANDYRYFPDPDLLPLTIDADFIAEVVAGMPELPDARRARFESDYGLSAYDADVLTSSRAQADYYEVVAEAGGDAKLAANWVMGELAAALNKAGLDITESPVDAGSLGQLVARIRDNTISGKIAKDVFAAIWSGEGGADQVIEAKGLRQITDTGAIEALVDEVLAANAEQVENYRSADPAKQPKMLGFFVGQIMKKSQGKANPQQVNELLRKKLG